MAKVYVQVVRRCDECPAFNGWGMSNNQCEKVVIKSTGKLRKLPKSTHQGIIPKWCPLEDGMSYLAKDILRRRK